MITRKRVRRRPFQDGDGGTTHHHLRTTVGVIVGWWWSLCLTTPPSSLAFTATPLMIPSARTPLVHTESYLSLEKSQDNLSQPPEEQSSSSWHTIPWYERCKNYTSSIHQTNTIPEIFQKMEEGNQALVAINNGVRRNATSTSLALQAAALARTTKLARTGAITQEEMFLCYNRLLQEIGQSITSIRPYLSLDHVDPLTEIAIACGSSRLAIANETTTSTTPHPTLSLVWQCLSQELDVTRRLHPNRWFDLLRASSLSYHSVNKKEDEKIRQQLDELMARLLLRLGRSDALGRLSTSRLVLSLDVLNHRPIHTFRVQESDVSSFLISICRRLRKQKRRNELTKTQLLKTTIFARRLLLRQCPKYSGSNRNSLNAFLISEDSLQSSLAVQRSDESTNPVLVDELESLLFTMCQTFLYRAKNSTSGPSPISSSDILTMMECASTLSTRNEVMEQTLVELLEDKLASGSEILDPSGITMALKTMVVWRISSHSSLVQRLGVHFASGVNEGTIDVSQSLAILRCVVLLHRNDAATVHTFFTPSVGLLSELDALHQINNVQELSNILWLFNSAKYFHHDIILNVSNQVLHLVETKGGFDMSPRVACRILRALTETMTRVQPTSGWTMELQTVLFRLFDVLGEAMLSSRITPSEVSSAMTAYARAAYTRDLGIFDHLTTLMGNDIDDYTNRQVVQGLWSCAKLYSYEESSTPLEEGLIPTYLLTADLFKQRLVDRLDSLNVKDTAQTLYALGLLGYQDDDDITALSQHAKTLCMEFSGQELANVLWALGKVRSQSFDVVYSLIRRVDSDGNLFLSAQEASNILYALGLMDLRDEAVFTRLCNVIIDQIDSASAQSVANVLWASRAVYFKPPQQLLDTWAVKKLGLVSVELEEK